MVVSYKWPTITFYSSYAFLLMWFVCNALLFYTTYGAYKGQPQYYYLHSMLGSGLCASRGSGAVLNLNCGLILIPVCKWSATFIRRWCVSGDWIRQVFNHAKVVHMTCAFTILVASGIHTVAHVANAVNFSRYYNPYWPVINMAQYPGQHPLWMVFNSVPGISGVLMVFILVAIMVTSTRWFRTRYYNAFYYTHFLFAPFLILLVFHPTSGLMKEQINYKDHVPGCGRNGTDPCGQPPLFIPMETQTWIWVSIPLAIYLIDVTIRRVIRKSNVSVSRMIVHGNVLELVIHYPIKNPQPGQYVLLQCPAISALEWHPFSLSSCCDLTYSYWTVHLKVSGDWCSQLKELLLLDRHVALYVDGPFASPLVDVLHTETVICIAGGIGFTPFLASIQHLVRNGWSCKPYRLHLIWLVQKAESFLWAAVALNQLIEDAWSSPVPDKLEVRLHVTRITNQSVETSIRHQYPNLFRRLEYGRPDWKETFSRWREIYEGELVHVFSCGPKQLNQQIKEMCSIYNFVFSHEHFS